MVYNTMFSLAYMTVDTINNEIYFREAKMINEYRVHHIATFVFYAAGVVAGYGVVTFNWFMLACEFGSLFMNKRLMLYKEEWNSVYGIFV